MKKVILISVIAMSVLVARDCRYEEQELNMSIQQYEDLQDEFRYEDKQRANRQLSNSLNPYQPSNRSPSEEFTKNLQEASDLEAKYNIRFNRLNKRIEQAIQRLNNCRNGK